MFPVSLTLPVCHNERQTEQEEIRLRESKTCDIIADTQDRESMPLTPPARKLADLHLNLLKKPTKDTHASVICKLTRIHKLPELHAEIKRTSVIMMQVHLESMHLANLHVLRCLQDGEELPELDQDFTIAAAQLR